MTTAGSHHVLGEVVAQIVAGEIRLVHDGALLRITGFSRDESCEIARRLDRVLPRGEVVVVVGAREPVPGLEERLRLPTDRLPTSYRNDATIRNFVFVEVDRYSDEQSLKHLTTFSDRTVLGTDADASRSRRDDIVAIAWSEAGGMVDAVPAALSSALETVYVTLARLEHPSIRAWVDFVCAGCNAVAAIGRAVDEATAIEQIGIALDRLGLLPDPDLSRATPRERGERIESNHIARQRKDPKGKALEAEEIIALAERTTFSGSAGPLAEAEQLRVRRAVVALMEGDDNAARPQLGCWLQMFEKDRARGLGTRFRDHLVAKAPEQVVPYDDLDVTEELDHNDQEAARRLLEDGPEIVGVVPTRLRRAVERLAEPRSPAVADPLRHLLALFHELTEEQEGGTALQLELGWTPRRDGDDAKSLGLFVFLYGRTLTRIGQDSESCGRIRLTVAPSLTTVPMSPRREGARAEDEPGEEDDEEKGWAPVVLHLRAPESTDELRRFEWRPLDHTGLVAFREIIRASDRDHWTPGEADFEAWTRSALTGETPAGGVTTEAPDGITRRWLDLRAERLSELTRSGLDESSLLEYAQSWAELLHALFEQHVPRGTPDPEVTRFLSVDTWRPPVHSSVLLATHPLRLRWIGEHLMKMAKQLETAMDEGLRLNPVNDGFFFDQLENLSPHEQPAVLTMGDTFYLAVREDDWHQHFSVLRTSSTTEKDWLADLDDSSIDELSRVVAEYVEAHPHKAEGVSILLVVREHGARLLTRFLSKVFDQTPAPDEATLHVFAPRTEFADIERAVALVDDADERAERAFPRLSVVLHEWLDPRLGMPDLSTFDEPVDLAVVPNLFGIHTSDLQSTRSVMAGDAKFEPWLDPATYVEASGDPSQPGQNVSRILLPQRYDPVLWEWSTVNVRGFRNQPVGSTEIDYVALQVRFDLSRELYDDLHRIAHWVVTLDPFVGRDQIEALPNRPDVILVRPRLGKSLAYTLVVSSSTGREFLIGRLRARLELDLPERVRGDAERIAARLHEIGRQLSPGLVLRALGLGWATQELIGLAIARQLADEYAPLDPCEGFVGWISLDDHSGWFGPGKRTRADLARLSVSRTEEGTWDLGILVVEAKMREQVSALDQIAGQQVRNTLELLQSALTPRPDDVVPSESDPPREPDDGAFWRAELLQAIDQLPRTAGGIQSPAFSARTSDGGLSNKIPDAAREAFRSGGYTLRDARGFICLVSPEGRSERSETAQGHGLWRVAAEEMAKVLAVLVDGPVAPQPAGETPPTTGTPTKPCAPAAVEPDDVPAPRRPDPTSASSAAPPESTPEAPLVPKRRTGESRMVRDGSTALVEARYQKLLDVFVEHQVGVTRPNDEPFAEGPGFYVFRVRPSQGVRPDAIRRYADDVKLALELPAEAQIRSYIDSGCVVFEVPKRDEERYFVTAGELWLHTTFTTDRLYAPLGQDIRGRIIGVDFSSSDSPHLLIAGQTGSGKSIALETILLGLARHYPHERLRMALVDPKATELLALAGSPHLLAPIASDASEAIEFLEDAVGEMQRRRDVFRTVGARDLPQYNATLQDQGRTDFLPWRLLVLDEYADLVSDKDDRKKIEGYLQRLSQKARASGIHIIVATQRPSADVISTVVRANLPAQLALRVRSAMESNVVMAEAGAESLAGKGDAFLRTARGTIRVQCGKVDP